MTVEAARAVADAVLYEGYLLYPYRSTSAKNQVRWQYGIVGPAGALEAGVGEESALQTECLLEIDPDRDTRIDVHLRFLQVQSRTVEKARDAEQFEPVDELRVGSRSWLSWHEAVAQEIDVLDLAVRDLHAGKTVRIDVAGGDEVELLHDEEGTIVGRLDRRRCPLTAVLELQVLPSNGPDRLLMLRSRLANRTEWPVAAGHAPGTSARDLTARYSFVGTHFLFAIRDGAFVSLIDPPEWAGSAVPGCVNRRAWPVLIGAEGSCDVVLASPIILYDHPQLAPESPGDLYDSTEIDEILTLRIMTMTDEEKDAARATDSRAAAIIDRSDLMPPEVFEKLHGALRSFGSPPPAETPDAVVPDFPDFPDFPMLRTPSDASDAGSPSAESDDDVPWFDEGVDGRVSPETDTLMIGEVQISKGSRVRLRPSRRADAQDLFLADRTAVVMRIYSDVDGNSHVAVVLEDDPMSELHEWQGRYYYFGPEEVEPLKPRKTSSAEGAGP